MSLPSYLSRMFRLPTHLETLVPPPRDQVPQSRPWRGSLILPGTSPSQSGPHQNLHCTSAETEGDNQANLWPAHFYVQLVNHRPILQELQAWVKRNAPPMCMFMPDRLPDLAAHRQNHANFEALARSLSENQTVAIMPWNVPDRLSGAGIIILPTSTSKTLLVGVIFLTTAFPAFVTSGQPQASSSSRPLTVGYVPRHLSYNVSPGHTPYDPAPPNIASSQRHQGSSNQTYTGDNMGHYRG